MGDEIGHALVDAVLETAHGCIKRGTAIEAVLAKLERTSEFLLRRIVLEFLAQLINQAQELNDDVCRLAMVRLLDRKSLDAGLLREYTNLARAFISKAQVQHVSEWAAFVRSVEVYPDESGIREILASSERNLADVTNEEIIGYRNRRRLDLLATVGRDWLPDGLLDEFDRLTADYGLRRHPSRPGEIEITSFVGPTSPIPKAEFAALEIDELLNYLKSWIPVSRGLWGPSVEGLARTVEQLVRADPSKFASRAWDMRELPIAYIRAALAGWRDALQRDVMFATEEIWRLSAYVASQPDDGAEQDVRTYEGEAVWRYSQQDTAVVDRYSGSASA
jgi:hypothetical protein